MLFLLVLALVLVSFRFSLNEDAWDRSLEKLASLAEVIRENCYQDVSREEMTYSAIRGMPFLEPEGKVGYRYGDT